MSISEGMWDCCASRLSLLSQTRSCGTEGYEISVQKSKTRSCKTRQNPAPNDACSIRTAAAQRWTHFAFGARIAYSVAANAVTMFIGTEGELLSGRYCHEGGYNDYEGWKRGKK